MPPQLALWLLDPSGLTPHGFCLTWQPALIWLHAVSDGVIWFSYYSIPLALAYFVRRRRDLSFAWVFWLFVWFILACGTTHALSILTLWVPAYGLEGLIKLFTAILSSITAVVLWPLIPRLLELPSPAQLAAVNAELTHKIAEQEHTAGLLREREARYREIYNNTPAPLHTLDAHGRLTSVSDQWCELMGYTRREVIGSPIASFMEAALPWPDMLASLEETGSLRDLERRFIKKSGEAVDVLLSAKLERDAAGEPFRTLAVLTDITERKQTERALRASEERLRQAHKMEAIGKLTGGIAHDFNNMLTVVDGNLEMLRRRAADNPDLQRLAEAALRASRRAERLTAQLLAFSRRQRLDPKPLDLVNIMEGMGALLARTTGDQVKLEIDFPQTGLWPCLADRNQLESALLNLVINAKHAIAGEGTIRIVAENFNFAMSPAEAEEFCGDPPAAGDYLRVAVIDNGCGMTDEPKSRSWELAQPGRIGGKRGHDSRSHRPAGSPSG